MGMGALAEEISLVTLKEKENHQKNIGRKENGNNETKLASSNRCIKTMRARE